MSNADFGKIFILKRIEEQRSRLALIKSTFLHLAQNLKTIQRACVSKKLIPPILYSDLVFREFAERIDQLEINLERISINSDYGTIARQHRSLSSSIRGLMDTLARFQQLHDQRISGLHALKTIEYQPTLQSEYSLIGKVYNAVDALSYELMENCFGEKWIKEKQYVPLSLFGLEYSMLPLSETGPSCLITVPYYDCFRARFWPGLAHEVAHTMVESNGPLLKCMKYELYDLVDVLVYEFKDQEDAQRTVENYIYPQIVEVVCDIVSTYLCGPASLFSGSTMLNFSSRLGYHTFYDAIRYSTHPPIEVRMTAMRKVLDLLNVSSSYSSSEIILNGFQTFLEGKNIVPQDQIQEFIGGYSEESFLFDHTNLPGLIFDYKKAIELFTSSVVGVLKDSNLVPFNGEKWKDVTNTIKHGSLNGLNPIQLMNVAWVVRLEKIVGDSNLEKKPFLDKRKSEMKLFEMLVHNMYRYYEREVVPKVINPDL